METLEATSECQVSIVRSVREGVMVRRAAWERLQTEGASWCPGSRSDLLMAQDCMVMPAGKTIRLADGFPASKSYVTYSCALCMPAIQDRGEAHGVVGHE